MIAVIFEVTPAEARAERYFEIAALLKGELEQIDGFISVERFQSLTRPDTFLSLSFWRHEAAIVRWRNHEQHRQAQEEGRANVFDSYRLRIANVVRDYTKNERAQAPHDSNSALPPQP